MFHFRRTALAMRGSLSRERTDHPLDLIEALRAIAEQDDDQHAPLIPDEGQNGAEVTTVFAGGIEEFDGHFSVLRYQICAFL